MGRTIPSWRMVVEAEIAKWSRFKEFLRRDDREVFEDLVNQCKLYASAASTLAHPVKEFPLLLTMVFAQHKRLMALERKLMPAQEESPTLAERVLGWAQKKLDRDY